MKKVLRGLLPILVLAMVLAGCGGGGGGGTVPSAEMATISGVITGSSPNLLIPGATVTAAGGGRMFTTVSGPDGRYTLHLPAAAYTLTVAKETFNEATAAIEVAAGAALTRDFALVTGSGGTPSLPQNFQPEYYIYTGPAEFDFRGMAELMKNRQFPAYQPLAKTTRQSPGEYVYALEIIYYEITYDLLPEGAVGVRVYAGDDENGPFALIASVPFRALGDSKKQFDFYYLDPVLSPEHPRYYALTVYGTTGETDPTAPLEILPMAPCVLVSPADGEVCQSVRPTLKWNQVQDGAILLHLLSSPNGGYSVEVTGATEWTPWADLSPGIVYVWGITAYRNLDEFNRSYCSHSYSRTFTIPGN